MTPWLDMGDVTLLLGDCRHVLAELPDASVDVVLTDPPYGLEFMGREWDKFDRTGPASFENLGQPLGGYGPNGTRGRSPLQDRPRFSTMGNRAMLAFQAWCESWAVELLRVLKPGGHVAAFGGSRTYHRLTCGLEDAGFEVRDCLVWLYGSGFPKSLNVSGAIDGDAFGPVQEHGYLTDQAAAWHGFGSALKPAHEPIVLARKPLAGTVAANVLAFGTGALNIDACRIGETVETWPASRSYHAARGPKPRAAHGSGDGATQGTGSAPPGRWPANVLLDGDAAALLDQTTGEQSRFFYTAKAASAERNLHGADNTHPTVKPLDLMRWLVRLLAPPGGVILDPFVGSGTTCLAARCEGHRSIGIDQAEEYLRIAERRLAQGSLLTGGAA